MAGEDDRSGGTASRLSAFDPRARRPALAVAGPSGTDEPAARLPLPDRGAGGAGGIDLARGITIARAPFDYQAALMHMIEAAQSDPSEVRRLIYEIARRNLKREAWRTNPSLTPEQVKDSLSALETAIERVEIDLAGGRSSALPRLATALGPSGDAMDDAMDDRCAEPSAPVAAPGMLPAVRDRWSPASVPALSASAARRKPSAERPPQVEIVYPERDGRQEKLRRRVWLWFVVWPFVQLAGPIAFCVALYLILWGRVVQLPAPPPASAIEQLAAAVAELPTRTASGMPLPTSYGVYALSQGALNQLATLPIRPPDPRIMLSAEISKPSATTLPDGKVAFVVFLRELANNAPQKASVRVVARVARAITFEGGKAARADVQTTWRIRNNAYELTVAPLPANREMILLRPQAPDFAFPAGRYALVIDALAYDFTVDGEITDPAQCLESVAAVSGAVYTECGPR
jgi:hypothetical protein